MNLALDAAASGQLVIGGFPAPSAPGAIDRIIDLYPPEHRRQLQLSLAQNLRGVVAQVLLKKIFRRRVAAREVLLNTAAVRSVLAEGKTSQLPLAIEGGRPFGMAPLNDALVGYVLNGYVDIREAYHDAAGRQQKACWSMLKRHGFDHNLDSIERTCLTFGQNGFQLLPQKREAHILRSAR
jgi:twitching motility protein PilT